MEQIRQVRPLSWIRLPHFLRIMLFFLCGGKILLPSLLRPRNDVPNKHVYAFEFNLPFNL
jgi:hypothetical protein